MNIKSKIKNIIKGDKEEYFWPADIKGVLLTEIDKYSNMEKSSKAIPIIFNEDESRFKDLRTGEIFESLPLQTNCEHFSDKWYAEKIGNQILDYYTMNYAYEPKMTTRFFPACRLKSIVLEDVNNACCYNEGSSFGDKTLDKITFKKKAEKALDKIDVRWYSEDATRTQIIKFFDVASSILTKCCSIRTECHNRCQHEGAKVAEENQERRNRTEQSREF